MKRRIQTHLRLQSKRRAGTSRNSNIFQSTLIAAAHGKESEGAFTERPPQMRTSSYARTDPQPWRCTRGCHRRTHTCTYQLCTQCRHTGHSCCKCQRQLGEEAGRPTSRLIRHWIRKQANSTNNKQTISVLRPGGSGCSPAGSGSNPPLFIGTSRGEKPANNTPKPQPSKQPSKRPLRHRRHFFFTLPSFCLLSF